MDRDELSYYKVIGVFESKGGKGQTCRQDSLEAKGDKC